MSADCSCAGHPTGGLTGEPTPVHWLDHVHQAEDRAANPRTYRVGAAGPRQARDPRQMPLAQRGAFCTPVRTDLDDRRGQENRPREQAKRTGQENRPREQAKRTGRVIGMRYEFERGGRTVANVLWEGPGQVTVDVTDAA